MLLRRDAHKYDRSLYPRSRLPGMAVVVFENELAKELAQEAATEKAHRDATIRMFDAERRALEVAPEHQDAPVSHDSPTIRERW